MPNSVFHITIDGPDGHKFISFPSTDLEGGSPTWPDPLDASLGSLRGKAQVSNKLEFTADGKCGIGDSTTLRYYMQLTGQSLAPTQSQSETAPKVHTVKITVIKPGEPKLRDLPTLGKELNDLLKDADDKGLTRGQLPSIASEHRKLVGDVGYAAKLAEYARYNAKENSELTEQQWDVIFKNNRVLHCYNYDEKMGVLVKAPKPAFRMKSTAVEDQKTLGASKSSSQGAPQIPPFYIDDNVKVTVTELQNNFQETMTREGFKSVVVEASASPSRFGSSLSTAGSFANEHAYANQKADSRRVSSLNVAYKFPRVMVELDSSCLELTDECIQAADQVFDEAGVKNFHQTYGTTFVTCFNLGGSLHSTRTLNEAESKSLDQTKDKFRVAAGANFQSTKALITTGGDEVGNASLLQSLPLTWEARGGDTLTCTNPPVWAGTVKDHRLWRVMDQHRVVNLKGLLSTIDRWTYAKIQDPTAASWHGKDFTKDIEYRQYLEQVLFDACESKQNDALAERTQSYYVTDKFDLKAYNKFADSLEEPTWKLDKKEKWAVLDANVKIGLGLWAIHKKIAHVN